MSCNINCRCHKYHLHQCTECFLLHYNSNEDVTFTDSAVVDNVKIYLHRFGLPHNRVCSFYYPMIKICALLKKEIIFHSEHLKFVDYLFVNKTPQKTKELFHRAIIQYIGSSDGSDIAVGLDNANQIKWKVVNND